MFLLILMSLCEASLHPGVPVECVHWKYKSASPQRPHEAITDLFGYRENLNVDGDAHGGILYFKLGILSECIGVNDVGWNIAILKAA